tara:strand:+ start:42 stop:236 length:195 start_codon:yes stop_codon:yes gene_type:complete
MIDLSDAIVRAINSISYDLMNINPVDSRDEYFKKLNIITLLSNELDDELRTQGLKEDPEKDSGK